jgi:hypothetical protein
MEFVILTKCPLPKNNKVMNVHSWKWKLTEETITQSNVTKGSDPKYWDILTEILASFP